MMNKKLRIGLLIDNDTVPNWAYCMLKRIIASGLSEISLVVTKRLDGPPRKSSFSGILEDPKRTLFKFFMKFDRKRYALNPDALAKKKYADLVDCPVMEIETHGDDKHESFQEADIEKIRTFHIDVFIKLGFGILIGEILKSTKFGVWSYFHGDHDTIRGAYPGVWEFLEQWAETGTTLHILNGNDKDNILLYKSFSSTDKFGIHRNLNNSLWKSLSFIPRRLEELHRLGPEAFFQNIDKINAVPNFYYNQFYDSPENWELFKILIGKFWDKLINKIQGIFYFNQWIVLYKIGADEGISKSFDKFERLLPPKDRFWADPFVIFKNNTYYIFLEELIYKKNKGTISVIEMNEKGEYGLPKLVLEKDYHLSYPFIFEENGHYYMIPETKGNKDIELYQCVDFPLKWELKKVLIANVLAVDATIFRYNEKYWMFVNIQENPGASTWDELFLFFSDSLTEDQWEPHPLNPIVSDVKCSRPAGNIFEQNGKIFRPAQNCSKRYGYGMQLREIITLNENEYEEKQIQSIYPNWQNDLIATHTLNQCGKLTVIDAQIKRRK